MLTSMIRNFGNLLFLKVLNRWVAGRSADDALRYCKNLNKKKSNCMVNYLGEHYTEVAPVFATVKEYKRLIDMMSRNSITIKPSQLGFNVLAKKDSEKFCEQQMLEIIKHAAEKKVFVWIDMEDRDSVDFTVRFYRKHISKYRMGICLQANVERTEKDLLGLIKLSEKHNVYVRLVKGIYQGDIEDPHELHVKFLSLISIAFEQSPKTFGIAVASHHTQAIELALKLQEEHKKKFFEIQVLKGVLPGYYEELRELGVKVVEYVPYGPDAFPYSIRRALKNPRFANSILFAPFFDTYHKLYG